MRNAIVSASSCHVLSISRPSVGLQSRRKLERGMLFTGADGDTFIVVQSVAFHPPEKGFSKGWYIRFALFDGGIKRNGYSAYYSPDEFSKILSDFGARIADVADVENYRTMINRRYSRLQQNPDFSVVMPLTRIAI